MAVSFQIGDGVLRQPVLMAAWLLVVAFMMISRIPTYSFKRVRVKREMVLPLLVVVGLVAAVLASYPWFVLSVMGLAYLGSIPFSYRAQRRFAAQQGETNVGAEAAVPVTESESSGDGTPMG
jgi:CDP-diacylglycerol--serine O-phosphatidyltransferase